MEPRVWAVDVLDPSTPAELSSTGSSAMTVDCCHSAIGYEPVLEFRVLKSYQTFTEFQQNYRCETSQPSSETETKTDQRVHKCERRPDTQCRPDHIVSPDSGPDPPRPDYDDECDSGAGGC